MDIKENEFKCAMCGEVYEKGISEEDARNELEINFGDISIEDCEIICDDCYEGTIKPTFN